MFKRLNILIPGIVVGLVLLLFYAALFTLSLAVGGAFVAVSLYLIWNIYLYYKNAPADNKKQVKALEKKINKKNSTINNLNNENTALSKHVTVLHAKLHSKPDQLKDVDDLTKKIKTQKSIIYTKDLQLKGLSDLANDNKSDLGETHKKNMALKEQVTKLNEEVTKDSTVINQLKSTPQETFNVDDELIKIDKFSGLEFEHYTAQLMRDIGFSDAYATKGSNDYGIDVIGDIDIHHDNYTDKFGIQCKLYDTRPVGYRAVEETTSGLHFYGLDYGIVLTNGSFTSNAVNGANHNAIALWDRQDLRVLILLAHNKINFASIHNLLNNAGY